MKGSCFLFVYYVWGDGRPRMDDGRLVFWVVGFELVGLKGD